MRPDEAWSGTLGILLSMLVAATPSSGATELKAWQGGATPELALHDLDGREHRLAAYRGKVVVVNFWATWCEPCRDEMSAFNRLRARMAGAPFAILAVNMAEGEASIERFLQHVSVDFPILLDRDGAIARMWRVRALPYTVVLGPDARIRFTALGELDWGAPAIEAQLRQLLPAR